MNNRRNINRMIVYAFKDVPCADCGVQYPPCVMDFDHIEDNKIANVNKFMVDANIDTMVTEILKCEVVCSNCHRLRTYKRLHGGYGVAV